MTDHEIASVVREVAQAHPGAYALVQGYPVTAFALVADGELRFPAAIFPSGQELPFSLLFDIRIFDELSEWHGWRDSDGVWGCRQLERTPEGCHALAPRTHVLWGTKVDQSLSDADWVCCTEDRGIRLYVPRAAVREIPDTAPFALEIIDYAKVEDDFTVTMEDSRIVGFRLNKQIHAHSRKEDAHE